MNDPSRKVRLVHVTTVPMSLRFLTGQPEFMRTHGVEVHAVSSPGGELEAFGEREGVPVHAIEMPRRVTPLHDLGAVTALARLLRGLAPDIVHAHTPKGGLLGMIAARLAGVRARIYHVHGLPFLTQRGARRLLLTSTERVSCTLATRVLAVSHSMRRVAVESGLCPAGKIAVPAGGSINGIDAARFSPAGAAERAEARARLGVPRAAVVLGFVGRVVREKGVVELATAWRALRKAHPDLILLMVGPFEPQDPIPSDVAAALRGDPRVRMIGLDWDTPRLYAAMDVVALPTYREGFPVVPLETAAMGLPIVGTAVPGCVDAIEGGVTGALVPPRDANALAAAIDAYLGDPDLRARHGAAARARVLRDFAQQRIWAELLSEYRLALGEAGR